MSRDAAHAWVRAARSAVPAALAAGAPSTVALAALVDYTVTPKRLRRGYEQRLSTGSPMAAYGAFAVGLALRDVLASRVPGAPPADPAGARRAGVLR